jgi:glutathione synthase
MAQQLHFEKHLLGGSSRVLKLAFVTDPIDSLKAWKDSTIAMMRAAENHGHEVFAIDCATLGWRRSEPGHPGGVFGLVRHLIMRPDDHDWYRESGCEWHPLRQFDAVIMRKDPPFDAEFLAATWLLERAEADGARIINRPGALRDHSEKLAIAELSRVHSTNPGGARHPALAALH